MSEIWKQCILVTALGIASTPFVHAQANGLEGSFKLRTGVALTQPKDHLSRKTLGFGLEVGFQTSVGRFSAELGYQYKAGDQYLEDVTAFPVASGAPIPAQNASVDSRKTKLDGITLRLAYGARLTPLLSWHGGIQLGGAKFRQEYIADIADAGWNTYEDTYNGVAKHSSVAVSPFAGVSFRFTPVSTLEVNVVGLRYTSVNYVHVAGTVSDWGAGHTSADFIVQKNSLLPHLEIAYAIHF